MVHPEFAKSWICELASLYYWALALLIPWLVARKEKHTSRKNLGTEELGDGQDVY
jgi:hypothetical protein